MTAEHRARLLALARAVAELESELRAARAEAVDKSAIRGVLGFLERARSELERAVGRVSVMSELSP